MKEIPLTQGKVSLVDDEDYDDLIQHKWHITQNGYAARNSQVNKHKSYILMHRKILNAPTGVEVDHMNGEKLDNRKCNLRLVSHQQNRHNSKGLSSTSSKYKGVIRRNGRWHASLKHLDRTIFLGVFDIEEDAACAYDNEARIRFGEFAKLNFPYLKKNLALPRRIIKTSKYTGVCFSKSDRKWVATLNHNHIKFYLGGFCTEEDAAKAYDQKALELFGKSAKLNFPLERQETNATTVCASACS